MADYNIKAEITADASGYEAGIKKAEKASKKLSTSVSKVIQGLGKNGLVGALGAVGLASSGLSATLGSVVKVARKVSETMNECTNAYKTQLIAERELDTAIQNNPFVSGASADALKQFASEMQKVSNYGDEELIPMMANLVSLGRTETETMQIMSVAMDMSAGMGISLDSAITQLNATLNGSIGRLGQQNAELKGLTEEELKQGKAIEILGEKFKGLSSATADTSKQLQNIKGDFKEALGQFTLPSSDMWNKFWTGFYEKGIAVLKKIDDWMDTSIIGEKMAENIEAQLKKVKGDKNKTGYAREAVSVITERELELLIKYLEGQKKLNANEKIMLEVAKERAKSIEYMNNIEKQYLDDLAEEKRLKEEAEAREKELAELRKKQEEEEAERQKQLAIQKEKEQKMLSDWQGKLFSIRIENLERQRELELKNEELTEEQKEDISKFYGEQILAMRLQQIEKNREEALNAENVTEEARLAINLYYENEITKAKQEEEKKRKKAKKEELEEEEEEENKTLSAIIKMSQEATKKIGHSCKKVSDRVKNVFAKIKSIFKGALDIFKFNPDDALNSLLAIEDTILTFFVETLPKLPSFFSSAIQSIIILIKTLINSIDWSNVQNIVNSIIDMLVQNAPAIVEDLLTLVLNIAQTLINAIIHFVESGGWKKLLDLLLMIQQRIENFFIENIDDIVNTIADMIPDLIEFLKNSIVSASKTLGKLAPKILPLIADLINAIVEVITSDEVIDSANEAVEGIVEGLVKAIVKLLPSAIINILNMAIKLANPQRVGKLVIAIIKGLVKAFKETDWLQVVKDCFMGFIDGIKELFGIHSPSTLFEEFGGYMVEGLWQGIKNLGGWLWDNIKNLFTNIINGIGDIFSSIGGKVSGAGSGIKNAFGNVKDFFSGLGDDIKNAFNGIGEKFKSVFSTASDNMKSAFSGVGDWFKSAFSTVSTNVSNAFSNFGSIAKSAWSNIKNGFGDVGSWFKSTFSKAVTNMKSAFSGLSTWFSSLTTVINNIFSNCAQKMKNVMKSAGDYIKSLAEDIVDGLSSVGGNIKDAVSSAGSKIKSFFGFANGTQSAPRGLALVGEAGPELVRFRGGEQVINNRNTQKALEGMGGTTINQNVTFNNLQDTSAFAMIQQLKQYNRSLAINGVI